MWDDGKEAATCVIGRRAGSCAFRWSRRLEKILRGRRGAAIRPAPDLITEGKPCGLSGARVLLPDAGLFLTLILSFPLCLTVTLYFSHFLFLSHSLTLSLFLSLSVVQLCL